MNLNWKPLTSNYFDTLYKLENQAFPSSSGTEFDPPKEKKIELYEQWHNPSINLSQVCLDDNGNLLGLISVVVVNQNGWNLIHDTSTHDLNEYKLRDNNLFTPGEDSEIGFHVYMIQKLDTSIEGFTELAYQAMFKKFNSYFAEWNKPKVLGLSGFSVAPSSIHIAFNVLNRHEIHMLDNHIVTNPNGNLEAVTIPDKKKFDELIAQGYKIRNRCRLTSVAFEQPSVVWKWLEESLQI